MSEIKKEKTLNERVEILEAICYIQEQTLTLQLASMKELYNKIKSIDEKVNNIKDLAKDNDRLRESLEIATNKTIN